MLHKRRLMEEDLDRMLPLVHRIWKEVYIPLIGEAQVNYMLENFQSKEAIQQDMAQGTCYDGLYLDHELVGYTAYQKEQDAVFISKLYLDSKFRGKGYMSKVFRWYELMVAPKGSLRLHVNKGNQRAISIYQHKGFQITKELVTDIGDGFVMDDYVLEKLIC